MSGEEGPDHQKQEQRGTRGSGEDGIRTHEARTSGFQIRKNLKTATLTTLRGKIFIREILHR